MKKLTLIFALVLATTFTFANGSTKNNRVEKPTFPTIERQIEILEEKIDSRIERVEKLEEKRQTEAFNQNTAFGIESNIEKSHIAINELMIELEELKGE